MTVKRDRWGAFVEHAPQPHQGAGPLAGLRLAVKDNIAVRGLPWTAGLPLYADRRAEADAACVASLRAQGATIVGVTTTDSAGFGMMTPGVENPLDATHSVGGSSGGSAAALAAGLADIALGTDTAGSVRVPAACCGVYGWKPAFGRVSTAGVTPLSTSFDHVGLLAARLDDLTRAACVLLAAPRPAGPRRPLVIAHDPARLDIVPDATAATVRRLLARLREQGHTPLEVHLPDSDTLADAHGAIVCAEARAVWAAHWPGDADRFGDTARRSLAYAQTVDDAALRAARTVVEAGRRMVASAFAGNDLLIGPTLSIPPPLVGQRRARGRSGDVAIVRAMMSETCTFNVSGHPALAIPAPVLIGRIPVSIQLAAADDATLLAAAPLVDAALSEIC